MSARNKRVGLIANVDKPGCAAALRAAGRALRRLGCGLLADEATAAMVPDLGLEPVRRLSVLARQVRLLVVFGGDGTMLRVARQLPAGAPPLLGVNMGGLGFLTAISENELDSVLPEVVAGRYRLDRRAMIASEALTGGKRIRQTALNDIVITRGLVSRLIELEVCVDGLLLTRYRGDGLVVATPTGSTAYSLAAGGAVVAPDAEVITLTPICPHTLSNRSVMVSLRSVVQVKVLSERMEVVLSADGQVQNQLNAGDVITIRRTAVRVDFVRLGSASFFDTLRQKMRWSGSSVTRE